MIAIGERVARKTQYVAHAECGEARSEALWAQRHDDRSARHHHSLEYPIGGFEHPGMTYEPAADPDM